MVNSAALAICHVHAVGRVAAGGFVWWHRGALQLTLVAKARFAMQHDRTMLLVEAPSLALADVHHGGDPARSLLRASDMVPFRPRVDVTLTGHAYAPGARAVRASAVRLGLFRDSVAVLDKVVHVMGDRTHADAQPVPFERMPLVYERAFGGPGCDANPVGCGLDGRGVPNLLDPSQPDQPTGYGALAPTWKRRRQWLTSTMRRDLARRVPVVDVDWRYFQAAPRDQQIAEVRGDEWLVIDGMDATLLRLATQLPNARATARLYFGDERREGVAMVADSLAIDADAHEVTLTWRAAVALPPATDLRLLRAAAAVELPPFAAELDAVEPSLRHVPSIASALEEADWRVDERAEAERGARGARFEGRPRDREVTRRDGLSTRNAAAAHVPSGRDAEATVIERRSAWSGVDDEATVTDAPVTAASSSRASTTIPDDSPTRDSDTAEAELELDVTLGSGGQASPLTLRSTERTRDDPLGEFSTERPPR